MSTIRIDLAYQLPSLRKFKARPRTPSAPASSDTPTTFKSKRHDTYQELVVWGEAGVAIVSLKPPVEVEERF